MSLILSNESLGTRKPMVHVTGLEFLQSPWQAEFARFTGKVNHVTCQGKRSWQLTLPAHAVLLPLCLWSARHWQGLSNSLVPLVLCREQLACNKTALGLGLLDSSVFILGETQQDLGIWAESCVMQSSWDYSALVGELINTLNKLSHLDQISFTDHWHLFYNINYLYWIGPKALAFDK